MANWREELLFEGPYDGPPSKLKREEEARARKAAREEAANKASKRSKKYRKYQQNTLDYKKERLKWQQDQSLKNDKERREKDTERRENEQKSRITGHLRDIKTQTISSKDPDSTAGAKVVGNVASLVGGIAKAGIAAGVHNIQKRNKAKRKAQIEAGTKKAQEKDAEMEASRKQPRLPPAGGTSGNRTLGQRAREYNSIRQREISNRTPESKPKPRDEWTQRAANRVDVPFNKPKRPTNEEYSCWREEFLCELGEIRRKMKKDKDAKIVNVMTGTNKITLFPTITEEVDNEGGMARNELSTAERAIKSLRKKIKSNKQQLPAWVQSKITKAADYIDSVADYMMGETEPVKEAYDDENETFRQHSRERFTAGPADDDRAHRTSSILQRMKEMNKDAKPKKKKKKN